MRFDFGERSSEERELEVRGAARGGGISEEERDDVVEKKEESVWEVSR